MCVCLSLHVHMLVVVVCSWGGPDRMESQQPGVGTNQSTVRQQRPPARRRGRSGQEEQPQLPREEEGRQTRLTSITDVEEWHVRNTFYKLLFITPQNYNFCPVSVSWIVFKPCCLLSPSLPCSPSQRSSRKQTRWAAECGSSPAPTLPARWSSSTPTSQAHWLTSSTSATPTCSASPACQVKVPVKPL